MRNARVCCCVQVMLRAQRRFQEENPEAAAKLERNAKFAYACCLCTLCLSCIPLCCCTPEADKRRLIELAQEEQRKLNTPSREGGGAAAAPRQEAQMSKGQKEREGK